MFSDIALSPGGSQIGSSPTATPLRDKAVDDDCDIASVGQSTTIPSGVKKHHWWHERCSRSHLGGMPVRIKASILSQLQKKPFRSIICPCLVTVLISLPHVSPQTTSTPGPPCPLHIYTQCRVGYLTDVRQSISDQQQPKKKNRIRKEH